MLQAFVGLSLIVVLVGLRLVSAFAVLHDPRLGWVVESAAIVLVANGLRRGWRAGQQGST